MDLTMIYIAILYPTFKIKTQLLIFVLSSNTPFDSFWFMP